MADTCAEFVFVVRWQRTAAGLFEVLWDMHPTWFSVVDKVLKLTFMVETVEC